MLLLMTLCIITGCKDKKKEEPTTTTTKDGITFVDKIELDKKQYIEQLKKVYIEDTDDYFIITEKVKWSIPEHEPGTTVSFIISIPYILHVDGVDYEGTYKLSTSSNSYAKDDNPKYDLKVTNLTKNYETQVLFTKKIN